ncbi:MAG: S8 family serine peptidase, partial [Calditrichia bacterium]|nr:S8 family serine peptidase [Calditrichia bacterium]
MRKITFFLFLLILLTISKTSFAQNPVLNFQLKQKEQKSDFLKPGSFYSKLNNYENVVSVKQIKYTQEFLDEIVCQMVCSDSSGLDELKQILLNSPEIEWVEENTKLKVYSNTLPSDSLINRQWYWFSTGADWLYANGYYEAAENKIPIAIIDTGVDYEHADLQGQFWVNNAEDLNNNNTIDEEDINGIDDDGNGVVDDVIGYDFTDAPDFPSAGDYLNEDPFPMDDYGSSGHGTLAAGIIAAKADNLIGIAGISPNAEIMALRAGSASGYLEVDDVVKAIFYAVNNGAKIINMSFGDSYPSVFLHQAVKYAFDNDVVLVAAAGNSGSDSPAYPAAWPEVLGIGSYNSNNNRSGFSNYGNWLSFSLPGESILSTAIGDKYSTVNGTSFSSPVAAAVISMPLSSALNDGDIDVNAFYSSLENCAINWGGSDFNEDFGYGVLKFPAALYNKQLEIDIHYPENFEVVSGDLLPVVASVWGENIKEYSFKITLGENELWNSSTYSRFLYYDTLETINISTFPQDTLLSLIMRVKTFADETYKKISSFTIDNSIPELMELTDLRWWNGAFQGDLIHVSSSNNCNAVLKVYNSGENLIYSRNSEGTGKEHFFTVNDNNNYYVKFSLNNSAGNSGIVPDSIIQLKAENTFLPSMPYKDMALFPYSGFIVDTLVDFNGNGFPEIVFSKSNADTVFGQIIIAEIQNSANAVEYDIKAVSEKPYIPRAVGDVNGDGKPG